MPRVKLPSGEVVDAVSADLTENGLVLTLEDGTTRILADRKLEPDLEPRTLEIIVQEKK